MWPFRRKASGTKPVQLIRLQVRVPENLNERKRKKLFKKLVKFSVIDYKDKRISEFFFTRFHVLSKDFLSSSMLNPMRLNAFEIFFSPKHQKKVLGVVDSFNCKVHSMDDATDGLHIEWSTWICHLYADDAMEYLVDSGFIKKDKRIKKLNDECPDCGDDMDFEDDLCCHNCGHNIAWNFYDIRKMCEQAAVSGGKFKAIKSAA